MMNKNVSNQTELQCNANSIIMDIITVREVGEELKRRLPQSIGSSGYLCSFPGSGIGALHVEFSFSNVS